MVSFEAADRADVKISLNNGPLQIVKTFTAADSDLGWQFHDIDISAWAVDSPIRVMFDAGMGALNDVLYLDDIVITGKR